MGAKKSRFKVGDRVSWRDGVVGEATGTVKAAWIDSRIGEVLYVERDGHAGERYPVDVAGDNARVVMRPAKGRKKGGERV